MNVAQHCDYVSEFSYLPSKPALIYSRFRNECFNRQVIYVSRQVSKYFFPPKADMVIFSQKHPTLPSHAPHSPLMIHWLLSMQHYHIKGRPCQHRRYACNVSKVLTKILTLVTSKAQTYINAVVSTLYKTGKCKWWDLFI